MYLESLLKDNRPYMKSDKKKYTAIPTCNTPITGIPYLNLRCRVLCRNVYIPAHAPNDPPATAIPSRWTSGVRHRFRDAFRLSIPYITKETVFTITRYKISNFNGWLFFNSPAKIRIFNQARFVGRKILCIFARMTERNELHKRNKHNGQYDFSRLMEEYPPLKKFVAPNAYGTTSIEFFNPQAVKALTKALLIS